MQIPPSRFTHASFGLAALSVVVLSGCENPETKQCRAKIQSSQESLLVMDKTDEASVEAALKEISVAIDACKSAKRAEDVAEAISAKRTISAHLDELRTRAKNAPKPLSAEEVTELEKNGDPNCPRGQGYKLPQSKKLIRCVGKSVVEKNWDEAVQHLKAQRFAVGLNAEKKLVVGEFGAERYLLHYEAKGSRTPPSCIEYTGAPGVPWKELVVRLASVHPGKLELGKPVTVGSRSLPLAVDGDAKQWTVLLGDCPKAATKLAPGADAAAGPDAGSGKK